MTKDTHLLVVYVATLLLSPLLLMTAVQGTPAFKTLSLICGLLLTGGSGGVSILGWRKAVRSYWLQRMLTASTITTLFGLVLIIFTLTRIQ